MIQVFKGSIFDSKCDLIIIPCNSLGGITPLVKKELMAHDIAYNLKYTSPGDITFVDNVSSFANASTIGYAASVDAIKDQSSEATLQKIMRKIKTYCQERSINKVNIPLLGTGAGGLSAKTSYGVMKSEFEDIRSITLCVYAFSEKAYDELKSERKPPVRKQIKNPRVFISYTGTSAENRKWVKDFAYRLRASGVDARLDLFHLKPGQDLPQWMTNEVIMADKVILICDKYYAEKADNRRGGVGWETMIIQGDMLTKQDQNKYVAIIRDEDIDHSLPVYVKSKYALNWTNEDQMDKEYDDLLLFLFDCDVEPPIGEIPSFIIDQMAK